jgi:hypothetical protein
MEKEYEEFVLTEGDFDERMYLSSERQADFGMDSNYEEYLKALDKQPAIKIMTPVSEVGKENYSIFSVSHSHSHC